MKLPKLQLPQQWLSIWYCGTLSALTAILATGTKTNNNIFCAESDKSIAVCARAWSASLAGLASFCIALIALLYTRRQFHLARNNRNLENLKRRLELCSALYTKLHILQGAYYEARRHLIHIEFLRQHLSDDIEIKNYSSEFVKSWDVLDRQRRDLNKFSLDQIADDDFQEIADDLSRNTDLKREAPSRLIAEAVQNFHNLKNHTSQDTVYKTLARDLRKDYQISYIRFHAASGLVLEQLTERLLMLEETARGLKATRQAIINSN